MLGYMNAGLRGRNNDYDIYLDAMVLIIIVFLAFFSILFLQSGIDKIIDRKGNLAWLKGHFEKSPLAKMVPFLLSVITGLEVLVGVMAVASIASVVFGIHFLRHFPLYTAAMACFTLLALFFGQRMAKDYEGAAGIVPYLIFSVLGLFVFTLFGYMTSLMGF